MKTILFLLGINLSLIAYSCDLCSVYLNLEPNDLKNSIGLNYRYRTFSQDKISFNTINDGQKHALGNTVISNSTSQAETYKSYDLWGNFFVSEKWQVYSQISFADNYYLEDDSVIYNISGVGDLLLLPKFMVYNTKVTDSSKWIQRLIFGAGISIPIGKFNQPYMVSPVTKNKSTVIYGAPYAELDPHMQAGTGSLDFVFSLEYQLRYNTLGLASSVLYRYANENSNQFRFANRFNLNNYIFKLIKIKKSQLAPNIGLNLESSKRDQFKKQDYLNSGGTSLFFSSGVKWYNNTIAMGVTYWSPIYQNLNDNQLQNDERIIMNLTYYL